NNRLPNQMLQQTAAAFLVLDRSLFLSAAAAAELGRSATEIHWMTKVIWSRLPRQLELLVREAETLGRPRPAELDATLDDYEARSGFRLPASYREFMHWFGPGALSTWFQICGLIPTRFHSRVAKVYDMDKQREMLEDPQRYWASSVTPEVLRRLVLFAATEG